MSEHESRHDEEGQDGEDREVKSAAPSDESKVVGDGADVPAGEGEEADEGEGQGSPPASDESGDGAAEAGAEGERDDRSELAHEIESDPASNPTDPMLRDIKGG